MDALAISTRAIRSGSSSNDSTYTALTNALISFTDRRDALASKIRSALAAAQFAGQALDDGAARVLIAEARSCWTRCGAQPPSHDMRAAGARPETRTQAASRSRATPPAGDEATFR